jgi:hypothetical protein
MRKTVQNCSYNIHRETHTKRKPPLELHVGGKKAAVRERRHHLRTERNDDLVVPWVNNSVCAGRRDSARALQKNRNA